MNVQGLYTSKNKSKHKLIGNIIKHSDSLFIAITETHLNENMFNAEVDIDQYEMFRSDRQDRICGGVALYVKHGYGSCEEGKFSNGI